MKNSFDMNRRSFLAANAGLSILAAPAVMGAASDRPPNVLFIICDQMRGDALGCMGNSNARTPYLDRLASQSSVFSHAFCNNPVCVPSRMSMFAGRYPHQTGRVSNRSWNEKELDMDGTLGAYFLQRGYRCGWVGKNHTYEKNELTDNFDYVSIRAREPFRKYSRFVPPHWHSHTLWPEEKCHPRLNTDEAIGFIESSNSNEPFFLHVSYFDPHPPYMAPDEFLVNYDSQDMRLPDTVALRSLSRRLQDFADGFRMDEVSDEGFRETLRHYHASVEWGVDYQVGRLMKALEEKGIEDDTIVIFTSDHGDFMADYRLVRKGIFLYDALLHVPLFVRAPGQAPAGRNQTLAQLMDIFPTLVDMTGGEADDALMGRSLLPFMRGESAPDEDALFTSGGYGQVEPVVNPSTNLDEEDETPLHTRVMEQCMEPTHETRMIRTRDFKLILNEDDPPELYAYSDGGIGERKNVADEPEHASLRRSLESRLNQWRKRTESL